MLTELFAQETEANRSQQGTEELLLKHFSGNTKKRDPIQTEGGAGSVFDNPFTSEREALFIYFLKGC